MKFIKTKNLAKTKYQDNLPGVCKWSWLTGDLTYFLFFFPRQRFSIPWANITMGIHSLHVHQWTAAGGRHEPAGTAEDRTLGLSIP